MPAAVTVPTATTSEHDQSNPLVVELNKFIPPEIVGQVIKIVAEVYGLSDPNLITNEPCMDPESEILEVWWSLGFPYNGTVQDANILESQVNDRIFELLQRSGLSPALSTSFSMRPNWPVEPVLTLPAHNQS